MSDDKETIEIARCAKELGEYTVICSYDRTREGTVIWVDWRITEAIAQEIRSGATLEAGKRMKAALEEAHKSMFERMGLPQTTHSVDNLMFAAPVAVAPEDRGPLLYRKDYVSMDHTEDPLEGAAEASGHIKWDGCNEITINGAHLCRGPDELKKLLDACVEACRAAAKRLTSRDWEES